MQVTSLDGNESYWSYSKVRRRDKVSKEHLKARTLLRQIFPTCVTLEEVPITVVKGKTLFVDFFLPLLKMVIEVHGRQHFEFVQHFHTDIFGWVQQQKNDREKDEWCKLNNLTLIVFPHNEGLEQWTNRIEV